MLINLPLNILFFGFIQSHKNNIDFTSVWEKRQPKISVVCTQVGEGFFHSDTVIDS